MIVHKLMIICLISIVAGCSQNDEYTIKTFLESKSIGYNENANNAVIVIPLNGCSGCIDTSIEFVIENLPKFRNLYCVIVTPSERVAKLRLGAGVDYARFIVDLEMTTSLKNLVETSPLIYIIENERIMKYPLNATNIDGELQDLERKLTSWQIQ